MPRDIRKRQRKIQKQKAKQKAEKNELARRASMGKRRQFELAASGGIIHCCAFSASTAVGMTTVLWSRRVSGGNVAWVVFLVDTYCLGVKDTTAGIDPAGIYEWHVYDKFNSNNQRSDLSPATARRLVEGAVAYARSLGISPGGEYQKVQPIFGDVDPNESEVKFEFGRDGRPCYVRGPHDGREKVKRILAALHESCGEGNFDYIIITDGSDSFGFDGPLAE